MQYRRLGNSGLWVSPLCLGTMMFGDQTDEAEARTIVDSARAAGINFIDTADAYASGRSEEIIGRLIADDRDRWVLATKVGNPRARMREDPNRRGLGRKWISQAIDESLRRLATDHVDIYYLHIPDAETPLEETIAAIDGVIRAGKALYWGFSNYRGWQIAELVHVAESMGVSPPVVAQPYYNAMNRMPEVEVLPACAHFGVGVVPYSPLARGVLTGKYAPAAAAPADTRAARGDKRMLETEFRDESLKLAQTIKEHAERRGTSAAHFAINWVLNNDLVDAVIAGPRTVGQWTDYLAALDAPFDAEDEALADALVAPGHPSTPGYSDPRFPVAGRKPRVPASEDRG